MPKNVAAARRLTTRIARSIPSSTNGIPRQMTKTAATAVSGVVLLAAKNSGLFDTTSKIG